MKKKLYGVLAALFWLAVWQGAALICGNVLLFPGPYDTLRALLDMAGTGIFWESLGMTLLRVLAGYFLAVIIGAFLGFLCHFSALADGLLSPVRTLVRCTPVASFIVLLWLWLSRDVVPAFVSMLMVVPILWTGVQEGLGDTDPLLLEMSQAYRFTHLQRLKEIYLPSLRSHFAAACATGLGFAWKSGISAEVIAVPLRAIGTGIHDTKVLLETDRLFAWTAAVILLSVLLEKGMKRLCGKGGKRK